MVIIRRSLPTKPSGQLAHAAEMHTAEHEECCLTMCHMQLLHCGQHRVEDCFFPPASTCAGRTYKISRRDVRWVRWSISDLAASGLIWFCRRTRHCMDVRWARWGPSTLAPLEPMRLLQRSSGHVPDGRQEGQVGPQRLSTIGTYFVVAEGKVLDG